MFKNKKGFIIKLRQSRTFKGLSAFMLLSFVFEIAQPTVSLALTEGPSQPEVQSFEPIGTTQMVDAFTGDFNYNIPLFNLPGPNGGYPVNIAYHAGVSMDDEASWVGLGWNINVGSLNRSMRGLPDEFQSELEAGSSDKAAADHDFLDVKADIKQSWTLGASLSTGYGFKKDDEILGISLSKLGLEKSTLGINTSLSVYYNNYNGVGASIGAGVGRSDSHFSYGLSLDSENGLGINASYSSTTEENLKVGKSSHKLSINFNGSLSVDYTITKKRREEYDATRLVVKKNVFGQDYMGSESYKGYKEKSSTYGSGMSFARNNFIPSIANKMNSFSLSINLKGGEESSIAFFETHSVGLFYNTQDIEDDDKKGRKRPVIGYAQAGSFYNDKYTQDFIRSNDGQVTRESKFLASSQYAYDVYSSSGQGLSGYFRAKRSDIGRSFDPDLQNKTYGVSIGFNVGVGTTAKLGLDGGGTYGETTQGPWNDDNDLDYDFQNPTPKGIKENVYYKAHGEPSILELDEIANLGNFDLVKLRLAPKVGDNATGAKRQISTSSFDVNGIANYRNNGDTKRVVRNTLIHNLKNEEVNNLGEFMVKYFTSVNQVHKSFPTQTLDRTVRSDVKIGKHPAGYKVLNQEGSYYVYALPAYNHKEVENLFSVPMPEDAPNKNTVPYRLNEDGDEVDYKLKNQDGIWDNQGHENMANSHKFINKTTKSPYAHSYLLTGVQGADYVDITNDGPTDDDLGYWVKFNYVRYAEKAKWRAPYTEAQYHRGQVYTSEDDKASYQYGEKEMWYMGQMETKSHIAVFKMSPRKDMREAAGEHSGTPILTGLKIDEIRIYEKKTFNALINSQIEYTDETMQDKALQVVHFKYDYSLCKNVPNNNHGTVSQNSSEISNQYGKLTLKSIYFTSKGSKRGERNKYVFNYHNNTSENHDYEKNAYDPWGTFKPTGTNYEHNSHLPYTNQFNQNWASGSGVWEPPYVAGATQAQEEEMTRNYQANLASNWCLKEIKLPSGGTIKIQYESDDYGYVQHKTANQMFKIEKMGDGMGTNELYNQGNETGEYDLNHAEKRRVYFKLEKPIPQSTSATDARDIVYNKYVAPIIQDENKERNLYFKVKMRLINHTSNYESDVYDYVSGYLPLEENGQNAENEYYFGATDPVNGYYTRGFVTIKRAVKRQKNNGQFAYFDNYHPLALAGWTYLQTNAQKLLNNPNSLQEEGGYNTPGELLAKLADLLNIVPATASNFGLIRPYCKSKQMARYIDLDHSVIRLASPDKIKYGGGHRVKQISITDNWSTPTGDVEKSREYGQIYDYTIEEGGQTISSGVATYEPQAGGDENPLKYPIYYLGKFNVMTRNNLFTEGPVNESMFPGASVGYRKVTVRSMNTQKQMDRKIANDSEELPRGGTGGVTVHEFYTAKDFPTLVEYSLLTEDRTKEDNSDDITETLDVFNMWIPIPLIGSVTRHYLHGVQAYKIELNDMHGKPKSVQSFELKNYEIESLPITSTEYFYQHKDIPYQGETVKQLINEVNIISNDGTHQISGTKRQMGVDVDVYTDQRENKSFHQEIGAEFNVDTPPWWPLGTVWPSFTNTKTLMRTYVTNKVVNRSGILYKTVTKDLQTSNETEVIAYDEKSGNPLVSKIKNEFGDYFYSYNIPAYYQYDGMGHAYQNINYNFSTQLSNVESDKFHSGSLFKFIPEADQIKYLVRGDEMLTTNRCVAVPNGLNTVIFPAKPESGFPGATLIDVPDSELENGTGSLPSGATFTYSENSDGSYSINDGLRPPFTVSRPTIVPFFDCDYVSTTEQSDFKKCYFLGWKYNSDGTIKYGLVKFIQDLGDASSEMHFNVDLKVIRSGRRNHYSAMAANYLTKGTINGQTPDNKIDEDDLISLDDAILKTYTSGDGSTVKTKKIPSNVLSATASLYREDWSSNMTDKDLVSLGRYQQAVDRDINPFISGNSGIWRPYKSYTYVGPRKSTGSMANNTTTNPKLKEDGVFSGEVKMFSWDLGNMEDYVSNWEWVNEVTRFSDDSYEIENVNRLGIYSSALYGYDNSLTLAVGGNAAYHELGSDDFETASLTNWNSDLRMKQNHMNFYSDPSSKNYAIVSETENIKNATYSGGTINFTISHPSDYVKMMLQNSVYTGEGLPKDIKSSLGLSLVTDQYGTKGQNGFIKGNENYFLNGSCTSYSYNATQDVITVTIKPYLHSYSEVNQPLPEGAKLHGKMTIYDRRPMNNSSENAGKATISNTKAHTGVKSMKVNATVVFDQPMLKAITGKKYIVSVWVSRDRNRVKTFKPTNGDDLVIPGVVYNNNFVPAMNYKVTYGKVVEGWQKIDIEYAGNWTADIVAFKFNPGAEALYVDDIRFSPKTGGITTYVYDPVKFWLKASLNVDNYATLFFYDEEGNLTIKKQETEKGIFTITESRGHVSEPAITGLEGTPAEFE